MTQITTTNALTDFDLCLALSQASVDTQLGFAWKAWKAGKQLTGNIKLFKDRDENGPFDSPFGLTAELEPITVDLAVENAKLGQVGVGLRLKSGSVVYPDARRGVPAEYPITDWQISFVTDLDKKPVDLDALRRIDPASYDEAKKTVAGSGLPDSVFSIEYLFLKLSKIDLMLDSNKKTVIPEGVPLAALNMAKARLDLWLKGEVGEYLLGTVVRRNSKQATPTFAMTDFVFSIHADTKAPTASTLNYLGEFSGRPLPAKLDEARLKVADAWLRPEQIDGREGNIAGIMAIGRAAFLEKYLLPKFASVFALVLIPEICGVSFGYQANWTPSIPKPTGLTWTFSHSQSASKVLPRFLNERTTAEASYTLALTAEPSSDAITIKGRLSVKVHYDGMWTAETSSHSEWIYTEGHQDLVGSMTLTGNGIGADFNLESRVSFTLKDPVVDRHEVGGAVKINELWKALGLIANTPEELMITYGRKYRDDLAKAMNDAFARLELDLRQHTFIPPGGGVFTFQNPRFSNAGDLIFQVLYLAPKK